jgi:hypothetical protein
MTLGNMREQGVRRTWLPTALTTPATRQAPIDASNHAVETEVPSFQRRDLPT